MSVVVDRIRYRHAPIRTLESLSKALGLPKDHLVSVSLRANSLYRPGPPQVKPDGTVRETIDACDPLKPIQIRIKDNILSRVDYPEYLNGFVRGRDYLRNAKMHAGSKYMVCMDIKNFFPSISSQVVMRVWKEFFHFGHDVSETLVGLTTLNGVVPQGGVTSPGISNLVFFKDEPLVVRKLKSLGFNYTRYVDDIVVSSGDLVSDQQKSAAISLVYGMLYRNGFRPKRSKHESFHSGQRMMVTKLVANKKPSLPAEERSRIRGAVHSLELMVVNPEMQSEAKASLPSIAGRVSKLKRFHPAEGDALSKRVGIVRAALASAQSGA